MSELVRTILIVEDQERWQNRIKRYCQSVHKELYGTDAEIIAVSNRTDAIAELKSHPVIHFASIDLNLAEDIPSERQPGGLQLLKEMRSHSPKTVSIVVSGEFNMKFPAISKKYGVLTFQQKNDEFYDTYMTALKAALLYVDARELFDQEDYRNALDKWQQAKAVVKPIEETVAEDWSFPTDIEREIENLERERYRASVTHSVTGLPTSKLIEKELAKLLSQTDEWLLFYIEIKNLDAFTQSQGRSQADALLEVTKDIIKNAFIGQNWPVNFFGQTSDDIFVVTSNDLSRSKHALDELVKDIKDNFDTFSLLHYDRCTRERGKITYTDVNGVQKEVPLASLIIGIVQEQRNKSERFGSYSDIRQLDKVARDAARSNQLVNNGDY
jgi:GGDEF domain-containing protein/ActR/RegA family two-component response regulator